MMSDFNHKNMLAVKQHSEATRNLVRELEKKLTAIDAQAARLALVEKQLKVLQVKLYSGGASSGN